MLDVEKYEQHARDGECFICKIVDGTHEFAHGEIWRDDTAIAFLNRYPTVLGYALVAPLAHRRSLIDDLDTDEYLELQDLVYRIGCALRAVVPLPPGTPYAEQQYQALMVETCGYLDMSEHEHASLAAAIRAAFPCR